MTDSKNSYPVSGDLASSHTKTDDDVKVAVDFKNSRGDGGSPADVRITIDDDMERRKREKGSLEILSHDGPEAKLKDKGDFKPGTYAIEAHQQNDEKNPRREGTNTVPVLIRRIDSQEILPKPFKTTTQLIICSYLSCISCLFIGAWAAKYALKTKMQRNKGNYTAATHSARRTCQFMVAGFIGGLCLVILFIGLTFGVWLKEGH